MSTLGLGPVKRLCPGKELFHWEEAKCDKGLVYVARPASKEIQEIHPFIPLSICQCIMHRACFARTGDVM
jgi:hypothetical protein